MRIYLDMCSIQRPLDDKTQIRIRVESEAVLAILALCESGVVRVGVLRRPRVRGRPEPAPDRKAYAGDVLRRARRFVKLSPEVEERARTYNAAGLKPLDALHLSCAVEAGADDFCTCDDRLLKRARAIHSGPPKVVAPLELIREIGS